MASAIDGITPLSPEPPGEREAPGDGSGHRRREDQARALQELLASLIESQKAAAEVEVEDIRSQLTDLSRRFVALDRQMLTRTRGAEGLQSLAHVPASAAQELDRLLTIPGVCSVEVAGTELQVLTDPLRLGWQDTTYDLGTYRILLDLTGDVRIESVTRLGPKLYWDHPHVQNGLPCLGNLREGVLKLIAEYELALAVQVLMDFLSTYNPDTAYCPVEGWPKL